MRVYQEARNIFAREITDPTLVFDEEAVVASQPDFAVSAAPKRPRRLHWKGEKRPSRRTRQQDAKLPMRVKVSAKAIAVSSNRRSIG